MDATLSCMRNRKVPNSFVYKGAAAEAAGASAAASACVAEVTRTYWNYVHLALAASLLPLDYIEAAL